MDVRKEVRHIDLYKAENFGTSPTNSASPRRRVYEVLEALECLPREIHDDETKEMWRLKINELFCAFPPREHRSAPEFAVVRIQADILLAGLDKDGKNKTLFQRGRDRTSSLNNTLQDFLNSVSDFRGGKNSPRGIRTQSPRRQVKSPSAQSVFGDYIGEDTQTAEHQKTTPLQNHGAM